MRFQNWIAIRGCAISRIRMVLCLDGRLRGLGGTFRNRCTERYTQFRKRPEPSQERRIITYVTHKLSDENMESKIHLSL